jgi:hypothetical protein
MTMYDRRRSRRPNDFLSSRISERVSGLLVFPRPILLNAQTASNPADQRLGASLEARRIVERAMSAMGGQPAFASVHDISRTLTGTRVDIGQALRPDSPYTTEPLTLRDVVELNSGRIFLDLSSGVLGKGLRAQ